MMNGENGNIWFAAVAVIAVGFGLGCVSGWRVLLRHAAAGDDAGVGQRGQGLTLIYTGGQPKGRSAELMQIIGTGRTADTSRTY